MSRIPTLADLGDVRGKRVLVRTDFNVPMENGEITDDFRIRAALPTINWLTERGAQVVCASHLGRPKGKPEPKYSMDAVRARLAELAPGVELLENLRFDAGEEGNDPAFVARLVEGMREASECGAVCAQLVSGSGPAVAAERPARLARLEQSLAEIAVQAARLAATHNPDGAEVRVADENLPGKWHIAWSVWSANRANAA